MAHLNVANSSAAGVGMTLTLPSDLGKHRLIALEIELYSTNNRSGVATPIIVTSTNMPGPMQIFFATAGQTGTVIDRHVQFGGDYLESLLASTVTTFVFPAVVNARWNANCIYELAG